MSGRIFVLGNATLDQVFAVDRLPAAGETLLAASMFTCAGGKGLNQAIASARTGTPTILAAGIGRDEPARLLKATVSAEVDLSARWQEGDGPSDTSAIWVASSGENAIVSTAIHAGALSENSARRLIADIGPRDILLMQGNLSLSTTEAAARFGRAAGTRVLLNTAPLAWDCRPFAAALDIMIANAPESLALTGEPDPARAARILVDQTSCTAIVTLGPAGILVARQDRIVALPAPPVDVIDTAGAGDMFCGTLAGELGAGRDLLAAAALAIRAASLSVTRRGTTPSFPTRSEIASLRSGTE